MFDDYDTCYECRTPIAVKRQICMSCLEKLKDDSKLLDFIESFAGDLRIDLIYYDEDGNLIDAEDREWEISWRNSSPIRGLTLRQALLDACTAEKQENEEWLEQARKKTDAMLQM